MSVANSIMQSNGALTSLSVPVLATVSGYVTHLLDFDVVLRNLLGCSVTAFTCCCVV